MAKGSLNGSGLSVLRSSPVTVTLYAGLVLIVLPAGRVAGDNPALYVESALITVALVTFCGKILLGERVVPLALCENGTVNTNAVCTPFPPEIWLITVIGVPT